MKHKNKIKKLEAVQNWYDRQDNNYKHDHKRPGSLKYK